MQFREVTWSQQLHYQRLLHGAGAESTERRCALAVLGWRRLAVLLLPNPLLLTCLLPHPLLLPQLNTACPTTLVRHCGRSSARARTPKTWSRCC
jgi:hypothetical protein